MDFAILLIIFCGILIALVVLRTRFSSLEIKVTDLIVALVPAVIYLLLSGNIKSLELGDLKIETAFKEAASASVEGNIGMLTGAGRLPTEIISSSSKGGVNKIPQLVSEKVEAITFKLNQGSYYYGPAIREYLNELTRYDFFQYIIILNDDASFFGVIDAHVAAQLMDKGQVASYSDFADALNRGDEMLLQRFPRFIGARDALQSTTTKAKALEKMNSLARDNLPAVDESNIFQGMINRSTLTASLLVDITQTISGTGSIQ